MPGHKLNLNPTLLDSFAASVQTVVFGLVLHEHVNGLLEWEQITRQSAWKLGKDSISP